MSVVSRKSQVGKREQVVGSGQLLAASDYLRLPTVLAFCNRQLATSYLRLTTMETRGYRELGVWQKAMDLVVACYRATESFPKAELYGLTSQLRRAAVSVPANIAEGQARYSTGAFNQFLCIATGSLAELETHVLIAVRLGYVTADEVSDIIDKASEVGRMLNGLRKSLTKPGGKVSRPEESTN